MRYIAFLFASFTLTTLSLAAPAIIPAPPQIAASGYLLIDANSGKVIVESNADERLPPASLTKLMTSYVLSYDLKNNPNINNDDMVLISKRAWAQNPVFAGSSLMWIEVGKQVPLGELHKGIVISSGNDASVAVAEHLAGSEQAFADVMNQHAQILGMENTHFVNAHGLPDPEHYTTARDLAKLAQAILKFPESYALYSQHDYTYNNIRTTNRNRLLFKDPSVDGLKTGHTSEAGYCLVTSAKRNDMRLISVVMGTSSESARERETQKLLSYGFRYFETHQLYDAGAELTDSKVWAGNSDSLKLGVSRDIHLTIPRGQHDNIKAVLNIDETIKAPVTKGKVYGELVVSLAGETLLQEPLVALESVEEGGLFKRLWAGIVLFFKQLLAF
ncbi:D-alanyl-D-alanine carboxypeptidase [Dasania sp. GY-MA-18]|uniref:serine-type D-Ala-D-Ala carboxypeptidase n=1 Tax=Dasania phycosphaerae TaxID=2950436 RepID=A0A9J6RGN3_9GAMM|nr:MULTISPECIES: D-alanyl-D-alanine carboxypeptidase family protein [Dasania]MCR8921208.1 D-alanyl-D-alanine carboxypeptidase [Dasania sp. GY-MA-18]MCZ0863636.1 D-alanyl-D-alanine carboxypeptidase [Dasania phycosphaerae]MCZ0867364.1 D-alanyl-D-alanine carboxypeptidase [Dasania phycosphaerae]